MVFTENSYLNTDYSEYMVRCLGDQYGKEKLAWIFGLTDIHKLRISLIYQLWTIKNHFSQN